MGSLITTRSTCKLRSKASENWIWICLEVEHYKYIYENSKMDDSDYDFLFKVVLIGDSGVGKSSLLKQLTEKSFLPDLRTTVGVEFSLHEMEIDGKKIRTQIWDTAGQERYKAVTKLFYRKANGIFLVYDLTSHSSFRGLERWREEAVMHAEKDAVLALVGNKVDLKHLRTVNRIEAQKYAEQHEMCFIETSAAESTNVELAFETIIREMYNAALFKEENTQKETQDLKYVIPKEKKPKNALNNCCSQ